MYIFYVLKQIYTYFCLNFFFCADAQKVVRGYVFKTYYFVLFHFALIVNKNI